MCTFNLTVAVCGCFDAECKMRMPELEEEGLHAVINRPGGHILTIRSYYRVSGLCLGNFTNRDPDRLVVRLGLREDQANSTMDCTDRRFVYKEYYGGMEMKKCVVTCEECLARCTQPLVEPQAPGQRERTPKPKRRVFFIRRRINKS